MAPGPIKTPEEEFSLEERIRRRAYEIYEERGGGGSEIEDWLQAEREISDLREEGEQG